MIWIEFADNGNVRFWTADSNAAVLRWGAKAGDYAYQKVGAETPDERQRKIVAWLRKASDLPGSARAQAGYLNCQSLANCVEAGEHMKEGG